MWKFLTILLATIILAQQPIGAQPLDVFFKTGTDAADNKNGTKPLKLKLPPNLLKASEGNTELEKKGVQDGELQPIKEEDRKEKKKQEKQQKRKQFYSQKSQIEKSYTRLLEGKELRQFGYEIFLRVEEEEKVINVTDYRLGPSDLLVIYFWGDPVDVLGLESYFVTEVDREGKVYIPSVGIVYAWGKTIKDFKAELRKLLEKKFKKFNIEVSLAKLRSFPVLVSGFVNEPGVVSAKGTDTVIDVLIRAGGVSKNGSLRKIVINRKTEGGYKEIELDLYDVLVYGKPLEFIIREGDLIYVPPIGKVVGIAGSVKRPGIYELKYEENLNDILRLAGGPLPSVYSRVVKVLRFENNRVKVYETSLEEDRISARDGDLFVVEDVLQNRYAEGVEVEGVVSYPGRYSLEETPTLSELIKKVGITPDTNLYYGEIVRLKEGVYEPEVIRFRPVDILKGRRDIKLINYDVIRFFPKWVYAPVLVSGEVLNPSVVPYYKGITLLDVLRDRKFTYPVEKLKAEIFSNGNVVKTVYLYDLLVRGEGNTVLEEGARVFIRKTQKVERGEFVKILGEVKNPGIYPISSETTLYDALNRAGGLTEKAYLKGLVLIRESARKAQKEHLDIALIALEESLLKGEEGITFLGTTGEEQLALKLALKKQRQLLDVIKEKARMGLGRIALDLPSTLEELKDSPENIRLENGDFIYVPTTPNYVFIVGHVYNQVSVPYSKGKSLSYYLSQVGGPSKEADLSNMYVIKASGRVVSRRNYEQFLAVEWREGKFYFVRNFLEMELEPGDTIVVPSEPKVPILWRPLIRDVVQIIFQAISTALLVRNL